MKPFSHRALSTAFTLAIAAGTAHAQFNYTETFKNGTASGWNFYTGNSSPGPRLTSGATPVAGDPEYGVKSVIDPTGQGWLRLATTTADQSNAAYFDTALPSLNNDITVKFSVAMWGDQGSAAGGDGITFFMRDASQPFSVGAFGGSIGYAQKTGIDGVTGGYFGVALDVYGNYSNPTEGRIGGVGAVPNAVVVRGPGTGQTGYNYLSGTGGYNYTATGTATVKDAGDPAVAGLPYSLSFPTATDRPNQTLSYRNVEITLSSTSQLTVKMQFGEDAVWRTLVTANMSSFTRPDMMAFGFSSGTGGANQVYEIGNSFSVTATAASNTYFWDNTASTNKGQWGTGGDANKNWLTDTNPPSKNNVIFNDSYVSSAQTVSLTSNQTVGSMYLSGKYGYTFNGASTLTFDAPTGSSYLVATKSPTGDSSHTINVDVAIKNDLIVDNFVPGQSVTLNGAFNGNNKNVTVEGDGTTNFNGAMTSVGTLTKLDDGKLTFATSATVANMDFGGGTLLLDSANLTISGTLHITGDSILDFGTSTASVLTAATLVIDSGVNLTVLNWTNAVDHFYVTNTVNSGTLSQITFSGFGPAGWKTGEIRPVPEPATYGTILVGLIVAAFAWMRWRQQQDQLAVRLQPVRTRRAQTPRHSIDV